MGNNAKADWDRTRASLNRRSPAEKQRSFDLELAPPLSGDPADVRMLPPLALSEPESIVDDPALVDFQSTLTNSQEERQNTSNLLQFWERIPRYSCGQINGVASSTDSKTVGIVKYQFQGDGGERYTLTMTPAQVEVEEKGVVQAMFCYPGSNEELIELALIKVALENGDILPPYESGAEGPEKAGRAEGRRLPSYGVHFTINQLMQQLKEWGRGRSYPSVMHSLDVLNKCHLAVKSNSDTGINARGAILTELISYQQNGFSRRDRNGFWTARFHPIISLGIHAGLYQQYNVTRFASIKTPAAHSIAKLAALHGRNMSESMPYSLTFSHFQKTTGLLQYKNASHARRRFKTEIESLKEMGLLNSIEFYDIKRGKRVVDIEARMFASPALVKEMKASHKRANILLMRRQMREQLV